MNCEGARESMILALYDELPVFEAQQLQQHLKGCEECHREVAGLKAVIAAMAHHPVSEPAPNLLTQSRMNLDLALDSMPAGGGWLSGLQCSAIDWLGHLRGAPALATLLLGIGFLGGNFTHRYQVEHAPRQQQTVVLTNASGGGVSSVAGITQLPGAMVEVRYNRQVPEVAQGSLDDPYIRRLLMLGTRVAANNAVRMDSVALLAGECGIGHDCQVEALLTSLRSDVNPGVRLKALEGLERYVSQDERVRDGMAQALLQDESAAVRTKAIALLEPVQGDTSVRQALRTVSTRDANPYIRTVSMQALVGSSSFQ